MKDFNCESCIHKEVCAGYEVTMPECKNYRPAVDAVEVVHGRWLSPKTPKGSAVILCSECGKTADWGYNYCPNCGAKMDGERKE